MKVSSAFPSNFIKCEDLQNRPARVKMNYVKLEDIGDDNKPVLYFIGKEKGMVLNKTNASAISAMYGDETENWSGEEIEIYPTETDYQGKRVPAIRIRPPSRQASPERVAPNARTRSEAPEDRFPPPVDNAAAFDDEIPF